MKRHAAFGLGIAAAAGVALSFRACDLGRRPMHTDEAVGAEKARLLAEENAWVYDPAEFHGPALAYATAPFLFAAAGGRLESASERTLRVVPALFGVGVVLLTLLLARGLGRPAALAAAALAAVSPAMVFYSRYYIHEMLLVFFTFGAIGSGWRYLKTRRAGWAAGAGAFLGLMHATKETAAIAFAAFAAGLAAVWAADRWIDGRRRSLREWAGARPLALAAGAAAAVSFLLYSSFLANMRGPLDSVLTYLVTARRAVGADVHAHPWHYYLKLLAWTKYGRYPLFTEAFVIVLAAAGGAAAFVRRGAFLRAGPATDAPAERAVGGAKAGAAAPEGAGAFPGRSLLARVADSLGARDATDVHLARFLAAYTLFMTVAYSTIPYKTPWCALSFLHGMILLAGVGAVALVRAVPRAALRGAVAAALLLGGVHLAWQAHLWNFRYPAARFNPLVYGHTSPDLKKNLVRLVEEIAAVSPRGRKMHVRVIAPESWPLPWYFRGYPNVDYWPELPEEPDAAVVIAAADAPADVKARLAPGYEAPGSFGLRPGVTLALYVRKDLWEAFLARAAGPAPEGPRP